MATLSNKIVVQKSKYTAISRETLDKDKPFDLIQTPVSQALENSHLLFGFFGLGKEGMKIVL